MEHYTSEGGPVNDLRDRIAEAIFKHSRPHDDWATYNDQGNHLACADAVIEALHPTDINVGTGFNAQIRLNDRVRAYLYDARWLLRDEELREDSDG